MSTAENGSFGVRPVCESEGFTIDPTTGLPYSTDRLYSGKIRELAEHTHINPETGQPFTDAELDSVQVNSVTRSPESRKSIQSGTLKYSVSRNRAYADDNAAHSMEYRVHLYNKKQVVYERALQDYVEQMELFNAKLIDDKPKKPKKPIDPRLQQKEQKIECINVHFNENTLCDCMRSFGCTDAQCADVLQAIGDINVSGGQPYTLHWSMLGVGGYTKYCTTVTGRLFTALMEALYKCAPIGEFVYDDGQCISVHYTDDQNNFLEFCSYVHSAFVHRRIDAAESAAMGFSGKTAHRSTERKNTYLVRDKMHTRGRLFSSCDRADIINRCFLVSFTPALAALVPVTEIGTGYVRCANVQTVVRAGEKMFRYITATGKARKRTLSGFWLEYTCTATGQLYTAFTQKSERAEKLSKLNSLNAIAADKFTAGQFGKNAVELQANSIRPASTVYPYSGFVKYVINSYFNMMFKRPVHKCNVVWQHRYERNNHGMDNSTPLFEIMTEKRDQFSTVEMHIMEVEQTTLDDLVAMYKHTRPDERRVQMFRDLRYASGEQTHTQTGAKVYKRMRDQLYRKVKAMMVDN